MEQVLKNWDLADLSMKKLVHESKQNKTWVISDKYCLKFYGNKKELDVAVQMNMALAAIGIPVATYKKTKNGDVTPDGQLNGSLRGMNLSPF